MILNFILILLAAICVDVLWTYYIRRVAQGKAVQAAIYAGLVYGNTVFITIMYTDNHWLGIAVIIGSIIGTYLAVKWDVRRHKRNIKHENI
jgi:hypothetical protein